MTTQMWTRIALALLASVAAALVLLNVLVWSGSLVDEPSAPASAPAPAPAPAASPAPTAPPAPTPAKAKQPAPKPEVSATSLTISATRGDCWVEVRADSSSGEALYAGTLRSGGTLRFHRDKLWLRLGASSNVDVMVNGRPSTVPPGTVELLLPA